MVISCALNWISRSLFERYIGGNGFAVWNVVKYDDGCRIIISLVMAMMRNSTASP